MSEDFKQSTESSLINIDEALGKIIPMGHYLLIRPEKPKNKTKTGILLPDSVKIFTYRGRVLEISPVLKAHYDKEETGLEARVGKNDTVIFRFTGGEAVSDVETENSNMLVPLASIIAKVEKPNAVRSTDIEGTIPL